MQHYLITGKGPVAFITQIPNFKSCVKTAALKHERNSSHFDLWKKKFKNLVDEMRAKHHKKHQESQKASHTAAGKKAPF